MKITVQSIHFDADEKLIKFVEEKTQKLKVFYDKIVEAEVFLRIDKSSETTNKISEIKLLVPGKELFAKKQCKSFEEATDEAIDALLKQLTKHKEKSI